MNKKEFGSAPEHFVEMQFNRALKAIGDKQENQHDVRIDWSELTAAAKDMAIASVRGDQTANIQAINAVNDAKETILADESLPSYVNSAFLDKFVTAVVNAVNKQSQEAQAAR